MVQEIELGTEYHDSIFAPESQPQEYQQPYVVGEGGGSAQREQRKAAFIVTMMSMTRGRGSKSPDFYNWISLIDAPFV